MKLAIITVMLAFCYCGSNANVYPWSLVQPEEIDYLQRRPRLVESDPEQLVDPEKGKKIIKKCESVGCGQYKVQDIARRLRRGGEIPRPTSEIKEMGFENLVPRSFIKPKLLRLLQEYYGEPEYSSGYGDYGQD